MKHKNEIRALASRLLKNPNTDALTHADGAKYGYIITYAALLTSNKKTLDYIEWYPGNLDDDEMDEFNNGVIAAMTDFGFIKAHRLFLSVVGCYRYTLFIDALAFNPSLARYDARTDEDIAWNNAEFRRNGSGAQARTKRIKTKGDAAKSAR